MTELKPAAWVEYSKTNPEHVRLWSHSLDAWANTNRTEKPVPLYSQQTVDQLIAERDAAIADTRRIDWLADRDNTIGNVQLPAACVMNSLRSAIDAAMRLDCTAL